MVVATCTNSEDFIRYAILQIPDDENSAYSGVGTTMQQYEETQNDRFIMGLFINSLGKVFASIE